MKVEDLLNGIRNALDNNNIDENSDNENTPEWDSLGHITILSCVDNMTAGASNKIDGMGQISSIKQVIDLLKAHNIIE